MAQFKFSLWLLFWLDGQETFDFLWDEGNSKKSFVKHGITCREAESVFFRPESIRFLGEQVLDECIRVISVRNLNKKEMKIYEKLCEK